jgi:hypothetical protein
MIRADVVPAHGVLEARDERCELVGELACVIQRKPHASDVARAPTRPATDLAAHELAQGNVDGRRSEPSAVRSPDVVAHLHARHAIARLLKRLRGLLRSLASSLAHLDSRPQLRGVTRTPTLCSADPIFARYRPRELVCRLGQLRVGGRDLQQVCSGRRPI